MSAKICPKCHCDNISYQTVSESKNGGCLMILFYILLAVTICGLLVLIPLLLRKKTKTVTYAVCQSCGHRWKV